MNFTKMLLKEMEEESVTTRKMLERIPDDKYDWQPHPKSMTIRQLATHIAELPTWVPMTFNTSELDFATSPYDPKTINDTKELVAYFEQCITEGKAALAAAADKDLEPKWVLRNGDNIYWESTKGDVIRFTFCQIVHHRAQLGVYLRLLDIPIPGSYGPSADENEFEPAREMA